MDRLTFFVARAHLLLRLQHLSRHPELVEKIEMATPKLQGARQAMAMLRHNLELDAEKLTTAISDVDAERSVVFSSAHDELAATRKEIADVKEFLADIKGSNGAPSGAGTPSKLPEVKLVGSEQTNGVLTDESKPEQLTVNGVSIS